VGRKSVYSPALLVTGYNVEDEDENEDEEDEGRSVQLSPCNIQP
jgi:hypothetical protein